MKYLLLIFILIYSSKSFSQDTLIQHTLLEQTFTKYHYSPPVKRALLESPKTKWGKLNPIYYISAGLLYTYQNLISEQIQADCMYEVSCSQSAKLNIQKYGLIRGTLLGFHQLNNCIPTAIYDYPDFKISSDEKIINF